MLTACSVVLQAVMCGVSTLVNNTVQQDDVTVVPSGGQVVNYCVGSLFLSGLSLDVVKCTSHGQLGQLHKTQQSDCQGTTPSPQHFF